MFFKRKETMKKRKTHVASGLIILVCAGIGIFIGACSMFEFSPVVMTPPSIPGASYLGSETCATCHEAQSKYFKLNDHSSITLNISDEDAEAGQVEGCESCHGPGSLHVEGEGDKTKIIRADPETACFKCHLDIKAKFKLQHHHPVLEGRMTCSDCHNMHGKDVTATGGAMLLGQDEACFKCHKEMKGPFVFPHEAMRDGCVACHNPHGSIMDKMLVAGQTITCLRCHFEQRLNRDVEDGNGWIGGSHHSDRGIGVGDECIDCHTRVHGSNNAKSSLRY